MLNDTINDPFEIDTTTSSDDIRAILEALLFATNEPLSLEKICEILREFSFSILPEDIELLLKDLNEDYSIHQKPFHIANINEGYLIRTNEEFRAYIDLLFRKKHSGQLSQAALEVLAIVVFRQPITRSQIEEVRGVDSSGLIQILLEKELIRVSGKLEVPGRPNLYSISKEFLSHFGLNNLSDLQSIGNMTKESLDKEVCCNFPFA